MHGLFSARPEVARNNHKPLGRRVAAATVGVLLIGWVVVPPPALAAGEAVLASGLVTRNGIPIAGAKVVARTWPNFATLAAVPVGGPADVRIVGTVVTNTSGRFQITLDPAAVPASHSEVDGDIAVELWALADGMEINWNFTATGPSSAPGTWSTGAADSSGESRPGEFRFDFGATPSVLEVDDPMSQWVGSAGNPLGLAGTVDGGAAPVAATPQQCWSAVPAGGTWDYDNREKFLSVYAWSGAKGAVEQAIGTSSSHTVGVAYKPAGGSWGLDGTLGKTVSTGAGQTVGGFVDAATYNSINYRIWNCGDPGNPEIILGQQYRPASWHDIFNEPYTYAPHQYFPYGCQPKSPSPDPSNPTKVRKNSGRNVTYSTGIGLGPIAVSARSGHDEGTTTIYTVLQKSKVCGNSQEGWLSASQIDLRKY